MSFTYLASPYSHPDPLVRDLRFLQVCQYAAACMDKGEAIFCPIAHSHPIDQHFASPQDFDFWMAQDIPLLRHASRLKVLMLPGWEASRGIARETEVAKMLGIPVEFVGP